MECLPHGVENAAQLIAHYSDIRKRGAVKAEVAARFVKPLRPPKPEPPAVVIPEYNLVYFGPEEIHETALSSCPKVSDIIKIVAKFYDIPVLDIRSDRRDARTVHPRHVAMYLARILTTRSLPDIGQRFGGRDHTTILSACRKMTKQIETDERLKHEVDVCRMKILKLAAAPS